MAETGGGLDCGGGAMRLLDTFCKAGGAGMGYYQAGFEVVGVDIEPQPRYPFEFHQADAFEYIAQHGGEFDVIHASPKCQKFSIMSRGRWQNKKHLDQIGPLRKILNQLGKPYIIENVSRAPLINPILLCGTMFGLQTKEGNQLHRHRLFEVNPQIYWLTTPCHHSGIQAVGVYGHSGGSSNRDGIKMFGVDVWKEVMQIDWMTGNELAQAIPPAYTKWIGERLLELLAVPS